MPSQGPLSPTVIKEAQQEDETMQQAMAGLLKDDGRMPDEYRHVQSQLQVADGILMRSVKVPPNEMVVVPVIPGKLEMAVMKMTRAMTGHAGYECMYRMLRSRCYFVKKMLRNEAVLMPSLVLHVTSLPDCCVIVLVFMAQSAMVGDTVMFTRWRSVSVCTCSD